MSIIDAHVHLYPTELNRDPLDWAASRSETHWAMLCTRQRKNGQAVQGFPGVNELLQAMDAAEVSRVVLQGWYWQWPETCVWHNHFMSICVKEHPDRFSAFATLHPAAGRDATLEIVRSARARGFCGLGELSPHSQGYDVGDPIFQEVMELAGELRLPVTLHVTDHESGHYPGRAETPLRDFLWLANTYPHTNFILAHWGGLLPLHEEEAEKLFNVFYDTAASPLLYDETIWKRFLEVVPVERLLFGSDYPLNLYPKKNQAPEMSHFISEAKHAGVDLSLLADNARRLFQLPAR